MDKNQVRELMANQDGDVEIYTDETLNHKEALVEFLEEKGLPSLLLMSSKKLEFRLLTKIL